MYFVQSFYLQITNIFNVTSKVFILYLDLRLLDCQFTKSCIFKLQFPDNFIKLIYKIQGVLIN